jgi:DNA-binding CsgD family transcriptional regulator/tetratricopeptide (TPR) repeat protein
VAEPPSALGRAPLVGRDGPLAQVEALLRRAAGGRGDVAAVLGPAGIGKSRLVRDAVAAAGADVVLTGRAVEGGGTPLRPVVEVLLAATRDVDLDAVPGLAPLRAALGRVVPGLGGGPTSAEASPVVVGEALLRLLRHLGGEHGAVLVLEDVHWADPDTLAVLDHLADHVAHAPVAVLATARTEAAAQGLAALRALVARRAATAVELEPLGAGDVADLARATLVADPTDAELRAVVERAEGIPFVVEELCAVARRGDLSDLAAAIPLTVADAVGRRLDALGPQAALLLTAGALLGRTPDWAVAGAVAGADDRAVVAGLRDAVDAGLLEVRGGDARFRHALTREAVLSRALPPTRRSLARRAAEEVERSTPPAGGWELAAALREAAGDRAAAAAHLHEAGREAHRRGALPSAAALLRRALDAEGPAHPDGRTVRDDLVEVLAAAGATDEALEEGARLLEDLDRAAAAPHRRAAAHVRLADAALAATRTAVARDHVDAAAALCTGPADGPLRARVDARAAEVAIAEGRDDDAAALARRALAAADGVRGLDDVVCAAEQVLGRLVRMHDLDEAAARFRRALEVAERAGLVLERMHALHELGTVEMFAGRSATLEAAGAAAREAGALSLAAVVDLQLVGLHGFRFRGEEALAAGRRCVEVAEALGLDRTLVMGLLQSAFGAVVAGDRPLAEELVRRALALADDPEVHAVAEGHVRALADLLDEDRPAALASVDRAMGHLRRSPVQPPGIFMCLWVLLLALDGEGVEAARAEVGGLGLVHLDLYAGILRAGDAVAMGRAGRGQAAARAVGEARDLLSRLRYDAWEALVLRLVAEAAARDGWGDPASWARIAADRFDATPHRRVADAARAVVRAVGERVPRRRPAAAAPPEPLRGYALTARELEVLALLGEVRSNRDIAEALFLSPRTVEKHVERLLAKTGTADRAQLARLAMSAGLVEVRGPAGRRT